MISRRTMLTVSKPAIRALSCLAGTLVLAFTSITSAQPTQPTTRPMMQPFGTYKLSEVRMRDVCIRPDESTKTYYMIGPARRGVRQYTSTDLKTWEGPKVIYEVPDDVWGEVRVTG